MSSDSRFGASASAFLAGAGTALLAGLILALVDGFAAGGGALLTVAGLWALPAFGFALYAGAVAAGFRDAFGPGAIGGLRDDRDRDAAWSGMVVAALICGVAISIAVPIVTKLIVVKAHRPEAGAAVLGPVVMLVAVGAGVFLVPLARLVAAGVRELPRLPIGYFAPVLAAVTAMALLYARSRLYGAGFDNAALPMAAIAQVVLLPVLTLVLAAILHGPLTALRQRVPARGAIVGGGLALAVALGLFTLRSQPSATVARAVTEHGLASRTFVTVMQSLSDRDGDGFSAFFRGPDCDDTDPMVNPSAKEIPGNGKDDNCQGGDRAAVAVDAPPDPAGAADAGVADAPAPTGPRLNVLIVMVDTLRVDRLGASGYQRDGKSISPRIDQFLGGATWFRRAYAQANNTPRSMPSFMASRYPSQVKVDKLYSKYPRVDDDNQLLFEQLAEAGYFTVAETSHFYFRPDRNFGQGFAEFNNDGALDIGPSNKDVAAPRIVPRAIARLEQLAASPDRPFAMFVHLFEPHSSWVEHEGMPPITEKGTAAHGQKYDYEVAFVDGWIGQLLDALDRTGLAERTVVVLMSDHGESFGDHNFAGQSFFHGTNLYEEQLRVPFAFRVPGQPGRALDDVVQLIDLAPTVTALAGVAPAAAWQGRSLAGALRGEPLPPRPAFAELLAYPGWDHDLKMAVSADGAWKIINVLSQRRKELYDLASDPKEQRDRYGDPAAADAKAKMEALLLEWVEVTLAQ